MQKNNQSNMFNEAADLFKQYSLDDEFKSNPSANKILAMLKDIAIGKKLAPDDWAIVQESLESKHLCSLFFNKNRDAISNQKIVADKKYVSVPIITFSWHGEMFVLLMKNIGLQNSASVKEVQWTAHGVRVDNKEREFVNNEEIWNLYENICNGDKDLTYLLAAAVRRINDLGFTLSTDEIKQIHPIDRNAAGYAEVSTIYRTEYFSVDLGEKNPEEILNQCQSQVSSRYAQWTKCFKLSDLKASVKENLNKDKEKYILNYQGENLPVRNTTWFFIIALQLLKEIELQPEALIKDPWQLRNINSLELAMNWVLRRMDEKVQITLFSEKNNKLSSAKIHAYAAKANLNEENFGFTTLKPERLVLLSLIANMTVLIKIKDNIELEKIVHKLNHQFFETHPSFVSNMDDRLKTMSAHFKQLIANHFQDSETDLLTLSEEDRNDIQQYKLLFATIHSTELDDRHKTIYRLSETDQEIAQIICINNKYSAAIVQEINTEIIKLIESEISQGNVERLEQYTVQERQCFGITGPVASGKSVSEGLIRKQLGNKGAAFIGSDEWNVILSQCLNLDNHFMMQRGKLTLAEAWFIKVLIWDRLKALELLNKGPNWIQETCDPNSVNIPEKGNMHIYINTADPSKAPDRVKARGDKSGRYVSASVATGSYKWPWINFLSLLKKINGNKNKDILIDIIDTDVMFGSNDNLSFDQRAKSATIATVKNGVLEIDNILRFISFVERSLSVNANPKNSQDIWQKSTAIYPYHVNYELNKLFDPCLNISIKYAGKALTQKEINKLIFQAKYIVPKTMINHLLLKRRELKIDNTTIDNQHTIINAVR